jgi:hypothetical protein
VKFKRAALMDKADGFHAGCSVGDTSDCVHCEQPNFRLQTLDSRLVVSVRERKSAERNRHHPRAS